MIKKSVLGLLLGGILLGVIGVIAFEATLSLTNTDEFCLSCHNHSIPNKEYLASSHANNRTGISPGCADCHVPKEFIPKMMRKMAAAKEVYAHLTGVIDTDEKYMAERERMKEHELQRFIDNDSATCRSCHDANKWNLAAQSRSAAKKHSADSGKTCVQCHEGIVHGSLEQQSDNGEQDLGF